MTAFSWYCSSLAIRSCRIIACSVFILLTSIARGGSATWDLNASSGNWNTATNWTPPTVPGRRAPLLEASPAVFRGVVYIGTEAGHLYALDEGTHLAAPSRGRKGPLL